MNNQEIIAQLEEAIRCRHMRAFASGSTVGSEMIDALIDALKAEVRIEAEQKAAEEAKAAAEKAEAERLETIRKIVREEIRTYRGVYIDERFSQAGSYGVQYSGIDQSQAIGRAVS